MASLQETVEIDGLQLGLRLFRTLESLLATNENAP